MFEGLHHQVEKSVFNNARLLLEKLAAGERNPATERKINALESLLEEDREVLGDTRGKARD